VVKVRAGERLTERQALEGLLLPSGNNLATLLARWDAGSEGAFLTRMNALSRTLGLRGTHYADSSGASSGTMSTAPDQVRLAMLALDLPAFRQIVAMPQATLPVAGRQYNVDALLGKDGVVGVKTGSTAKAGGCFVFAAHERLRGRQVTVVGALLHQLATPAQPSILAVVFHATTALLASARRTLARRSAFTRGATLAWLNAPGAGRVALKAASSVTLVGWPGLPIRATVSAPHTPVLPVKAGHTVATAVVSAGEQSAHVRLVASRGASKPSLDWRLTHP
jgi:D-alanyl-D-alanine carboxypeptidase (penicillin-binding protein 5/6)